MGLKGQKRTLVLAGIAILSVTANGVRAQEDRTVKRRIRIPSATQGSVGGDSHNSYVVRARKGQTLSVRLSWRRENDNSAELMVRHSGDFFNPEPVDFGKASNDRRRWTGKIPKTGDYYIYVIAYPSARYIVSVTAR